MMRPRVFGVLILFSVSGIYPFKRQAQMPLVFTPIQVPPASLSWGASMLPSGQMNGGFAKPRVRNSSRFMVTNHPLSFL